MAAGDMSGADMVRYDIDSVVRGHHAYKTVWTPVIEQLHLEKESGNPHDDFAVAIIKDHQPSASPLLAPGAITWPDENPWKPHNSSTRQLLETQHLFLLKCSDPPATKQDQAFIRDQP